MTNVAQSSTGDPGLSIRELAVATGVSAATLRTWEARHGYPAPRRLAGGHRRYSQDDIAVVADIVRRRSAGQTLGAAISAARDHEQVEPSIFAGMRRPHPELSVLRVGKSTMLALSRAIEDECCAKASSPLLFGAFQRRRFYTQSKRRWTEVARTARDAVVFADFDHGRARRRGAVLEVPITAGSPLRREWVVVCDAPDHPAALAGWEPPGQTRGERRFEMVWSVDPHVVRTAARCCAELVASPELAEGWSEALVEPAAAASADLRRAESLLSRSLGYLDDRI